MINKIWNWIKQAIRPHRQKDEHLEFYEDVPEPNIKLEKIKRKYKKDVE